MVRFTTVLYFLSVIISVDGHLRNKEHFAKAFKNLEVGMIILSCWLYGVC